MERNFNAPNIVEIGNVKSLDEWLSETEKALQEQGYGKAQFKLYNEAKLCYIKDFADNYQICLYFFDFRQFDKHEIGIQFECNLIGKGYASCFRASGFDISLQKFEAMSKAFFETMAKF